MYHLGLRLYWLTALILAVFNHKAALFIKGRWGILGRLKRAIPKDCHPVWFHCASLGEFEQGRPLIDAYHRAHPQEKILLTFFSPSGYEPRKHYANANWVFYLPLDTMYNAWRFLRIVKPSKAIFIKYEFWYNYLHTLRRKGIPTYVASSIFRKDQAFFRWYGWPFRSMLRCFTRLFVQNEDSKALLHAIGIDQVSVCGDTRFDRVAGLGTENHCPQVLREFFDHTRDLSRPCLIAGSSWPDDELHLAAVLEAFPQLDLVLAPHEIHKAHIDQILAQFAAFNPVCYSAYAAEGSQIPAARVLIIDAIGILSSIYRYASFCYIGGGFNPSGIHNTLEAATYGKAIVIGPQFSKFQEAKDLVAMDSAKTYRETPELIAALHEWLDQVPPQKMQEAGIRAANYVHSNLGATDKILGFIG